MTAELRRSSATAKAHVFLGDSPVALCGENRLRRMAFVPVSSITSPNEDVCKRCLKAALAVERLLSALREICAC